MSDTKAAHNTHALKACGRFTKRVKSAVVNCKRRDSILPGVAWLNSVIHRARGRRSAEWTPQLAADPPTMIWLMGMKTSLTKKPIKPVTMNPIAVRSATLLNSA